MIPFLGPYPKFAPGPVSKFAPKRDARQDVDVRHTKE